MNKIGCLVLVTIPFLLSCQNGPERTPFAGKEFEGVVTYHVAYSNFPAEFQYGDTMKLYYSHGNLLKISNGLSSQVAHHEVFLVAGNKYYFDKGDTLFSADISDNSWIDLGKETHTHPETRILGYTCDQITQETTLRKYSSMHFRQEYLYAQDVLPVNKEYFKGRKFNYYNRFTDQSGALYLKFTFTMNLLSSPLPQSYSYTAIGIKEEKIDPAMFYVNSAKAVAYKMD